MNRPCYALERQPYANDCFQGALEPQFTIQWQLCVLVFGVLYSTPRPVIPHIVAEARKATTAIPLFKKLVMQYECG